MHQSEVRKNGLQIIKDVYFHVLQSKEKEQWLRALTSARLHVAKLEWKVRCASVADDPNASFLVTQLWAWQSALDQLSARYGRRFIRPFLSPPSYAKRGNPSR